jgi:hypothetical protein
VINHNLKFDAKEYDLFLIPSHPRIIARGVNAIEVDAQTPVVELALVRKPSAEVILTSRRMPSANNGSRECSLSSHLTSFTHYLTYSPLLGPQPVSSLRRKAKSSAMN